MAWKKCGSCFLQKGRIHKESGIQDDYALWQLNSEFTYSLMAFRGADVMEGICTPVNYLHLLSYRMYLEKGSSSQSVVLD